MTQRRVENTRVHFWTFLPVSVNFIISKFFLMLFFHFRALESVSDRENATMTDIQNSESLVEESAKKSKSNGNSV